MGQKVHPLGFRLGVSQKHISHWFIDNNHYSQLVVEDQFIRDFFYKKFPGIASINIKRDLNRVVIEILSANTRDFPITVQSSAHSGQQKTGKSRAESTSSSSVQGTTNSGASSADSLCDQLLKELTIYRNTRLKKTFKSNRIDDQNKLSTSSPSTVDNRGALSPKSTAKPSSAGGEQGVTEINSPTESGMVEETVSAKTKLTKTESFGTQEVELFWTKVENPNTSAACLAEFIVEQLEKRVPFRRVLKRSIQKAEEASVEGIKVQISGRLNGAEIARSERIHKGQVPLHTLRAKIEYNSRTAKTIYGLLGVKVWVFNGFADLNEVKLLT